jgi:hypothetical protein
MRAESSTYRWGPTAPLRSHFMILRSARCSGQLTPMPSGGMPRPVGGRRLARPARWAAARRRGRGRAGGKGVATRDLGRLARFCAAMRARAACPTARLAPQRGGAATAPRPAGLPGRPPRVGCAAPLPRGRSWPGPGADRGRRRRQRRGARRSPVSRRQMRHTPRGAEGAPREEALRRCDPMLGTAHVRYVDVGPVWAAPRSQGATAAALVR